MIISKYLNKIPEHQADSHKGDYGRVFVLAGSKGMTGAAYLCCQGALRTGSGLVTCGIPKSLNQIMERKLTEVMTLPLAETESGCLSLESKDKILNFAAGCDVVAIGPGLGKDEQTQMLVKELIAEIEQPIVLDADGINAIEGELRLICIQDSNPPNPPCQGGLIITPHPGEMGRLIGKSIEEVQADREGIAKSVAKEAGVVVCLKGYQTVVANPEGEIYINKTGNAGMASGGTGDVLTGIIVSFVGQGMGDFDAAVVGVYLHGLAGDIAAEKKGERSMIASDLVKCLGVALRKVGIDKK